MRQPLSLRWRGAGRPQRQRVGSSFRVCLRQTAYWCAKRTQYAPFVPMTEAGRFGTAKQLRGTGGREDLEQREWFRRPLGETATTAGELTARPGQLGTAIPCPRRT